MNKVSVKKNYRHSLQSLIPSHVANIFGNTFVRLCYGKWVELSQWIPLVVNWEVQQLYMNGNHRQSIVLEIQNINFCNLTCLGLDGNELETIETLCRVRMEKLSFLFLNDNKLSTLKSTRKAYWPEFHRICLKNNCIFDIHHLDSFGTKHLTYIDIESSSYNKHQCPNINWMLKLPSEKLLIVNILSANRIEQNQVIKKIMSKWKDLK